MRTLTSICRKPFFLRVLALNSPEWCSILLGSITSLIYGAVTPSYALIFALVFGLFSQDIDSAERNARNYAIMVFCIGLAGGLCQFISSYAFARSGEALTVRMRVMSFATMLRQEMAWYDQENNQHGALVTRLSKDAAALKGMTGVTIGAFLNAVGTLIAGLIISFIAGWKLTLVLLCFTPLIVLTGFMLGQKISKAGQKKVISTHAERGSMYAAESFKNIRTVASLQIENHFIELYKEAYNKEFRSSLWQSQKIVLGNAIANTLMFFIQLTAFGYGARLVLDQEMTYVGVFQVFAVITYGTIAFGRSASMVPNYSQAKQASIKIMDLNSRQSIIDPDKETEGITLKKVGGTLEFRDVSFKYPSRKGRVLKNLSFTCGQGEATAIVGPSGSGKSSCIALLERFYDPQQGAVLLDGHDLRTLNVKWLRSIIGLVQQEPVLFNLSIRDNIAYGDTTRTFTDAEINEAARLADIHHTIIGLAQGYNTICGTSSQVQLAGGQKQRIAIARLLVRQPKIVLFDEATSALNTAVEENILRELDRARRDRTCVTVAHRLSTIRNSDKIVVLVHGRLNEQGTDTELSANSNGTYSQLLRAAGLDTTTKRDTDDSETKVEHF
ncbi:unnamed protein product [Rotaria sp. Silwood1]|nr:unnamed protein product [Rotaria sp. Silwood1]CAF1645788.1 unnamed protein product [Rotaria sp. Silwood1]CAF3793140.1 unnamed protein product [Rotaria sp. Silwood1]CAF3793150.1 unnamed protein product [Rotaria sp. Silwood1]CAF3894900.1 unnamed protein product [Rotaria sp. Silwood1]